MAIVKLTEDQEFDIGDVIINGITKKDYDFHFGKYKDLSFRNTVALDPGYVLWCCENIPWFTVTNVEALKEYAKGFKAMNAAWAASHRLHAERNRREREAANMRTYGNKYGRSWDWYYESLEEGNDIA